MMKWIWDPRFGNCIKLNHDRSVAKFFEVNNPDIAIMHLELYSAIANKLSTQDMPGIVLEIAPNNGYPFVFSWVPVDSGTHTDIVITSNTARTLPRPYSKCVDIETYSSPILTFMKQMGLNYSREFCLDVVAQYLINKELKCYDAT